MTDALRRALRYAPAIAMAAYAAAGLFSLLVTAPLLPDDLAIFVRAVRRAVAGQDPYQPAGIGAAFVYPPTALPLLAPLAWLPDRLVTPLWRTVSAALHGWACAVLLASVRCRASMTGPRFLPASGDADVARQGATEATAMPDAWKAPRVGPATVVLLAGACLYAPALESFWVGQSNAIVLLGLALFVTRGAPTSRWLADGGLAVAIAFKVTPALLLTVPAVRRDAGVIARVGAAVFGLAALSVLLGGTGPWRSYAATLHDLAVGENSGANLAAGALLARAGLTESVAGRIAGAAIPAVAAAWCLCLSGRARACNWPSLHGAIVCGALLASPVVWYHHLTWLVVPLAGLAAAGAGGWGRGLAMAGLALIQADRPVEVLCGLPPVLAACGAWLVFVAASLGLRGREGAPPLAMRGRPGEAAGAVAPRHARGVELELE